MPPQKHITVGPARGRDYITGKAAREDWEAGKEFKILTCGPDEGRYVSIRDADGIQVSIRYDHLRNVVRVS
jgi:hypothetical protein